MKALSTLLFICLLALIGCGNDDGDRAAKAGSDDTAIEKESGGRGTTITVGDSDFGSMLFDSSRQAIYVFENDRRGDTVCYGTCAEAWPPVLTDGEPRPGKGVNASLLGTVKATRRQGPGDIRGQTALLLRARAPRRSPLPQCEPERRLLVGHRP
jgi:hypothetical protein